MLPLFISIPVNLVVLNCYLAATKTMTTLTSGYFYKKERTHDHQPGVRISDHAIVSGCARNYPKGLHNYKTILERDYGDCDVSHGACDDA